MTPEDIIQSWHSKSASNYFDAPTNTIEWWKLAARERDFAIQAHANQRRKDSTELYASHPAEVALIGVLFHHMGFISPDELSLFIGAAWLHDVIEDQNIEKKFIEKNFGLRTANIVDAMSKRPKTPELPDPMADSLARLNEEGPLACLLKISDRISNLSSPPPVSWQSKNIQKYGQETFIITSTLSENLPQKACDIINSIATDYLQTHTRSRKSTLSRQPP